MICSVLTGQFIRLKFKERTALLERIIYMINLISIQIRYKNTDLYELLNCLISDTYLNKLRFLKTCRNYIQSDYSFDRAWEQSIQKSVVSLDKTDIELLNTFGQNLGKSDLGGQLNNCELHLESFNRQLNNSKDNEIRHGNFYFRLCVITGVFIVIILL